MTQITISKYICHRLHELGCDRLFGVPGDFVLGFLNELLDSNVKWVGTCNELNAAYAADGYARMRGIGGVVTTYAVGELSAINGIAGSWAEDVPVVNIVGCPYTDHYKKGTLLHHTLGDYRIPQKMFELITAYNILISETQNAAREIDKALYECVRLKKPVYIGICSDMVKKLILLPTVKMDYPLPGVSDLEVVDECMAEILDRINKAKKPLFIPGVLLGRYNLENKFKFLIDKVNIPYCTMLLSKSIIEEEHPLHIGLYCGNRGREYVREYAETSDCVIIFGEKLSDFNTGGFSANLNSRQTIYIERQHVNISHHYYNHVYIHDVIERLIDLVEPRDRASLNIVKASEGCVHRRQTERKYQPDNSLTMSSLFSRIAHWLPHDSIVIAETGSSLFSCSEMMLPVGAKFIGQTFYGSIGYTVGATLGVCMANPERRVILFIGDGSLQVTVQDISTMLRHGCKPTIFVLNNDGYTIERVIVDRSYNDIQMWDYQNMAKWFKGDATSSICETEGDLENALDKCDGSKLAINEVILGRMDCNDMLRKAGDSMAQNNDLMDDRL